MLLAILCFQSQVFLTVYALSCDMKTKTCTPELVKGPIKIAKAIDYSYNFDSDSKNYLPKDQTTVSGLTKKWLIFFNAHSNQELNLTSGYVPNTRTISWGTPVSIASKMFRTIGDVHKFSALLTEWTSGYRGYVTLIFIPPKTNLTYKRGYAAPQRGRSSADEAGGGYQARFLAIPAGTIVVTYKIHHTELSAKPESNLSIPWGAMIRDAKARVAKMGISETVLDSEISAPNNLNEMSRQDSSSFSCITKSKKVDLKGKETETDKSVSIPSCMY